jgi:hypothetical protein
MKVIFRFQLQYRCNDEEYELPALPPVNEEIAVNGVWWILKKVHWIADMDKKTCSPILYLVSNGEMTEEQIKFLENTQE